MITPSAGFLYVAPAPLGSDAHPGSVTLPFATLERAAAAVRPGDTVWIAPGVYHPIAPITPACSGTPEAPVVFRAQPGGEVVIDARLQMPVEPRAGVFWLQNHSWVVVDGLRVLNSRWAGFCIRECTGITVQNCSTRLTCASGIMVARSARIKILNNSVQQACTDPGDPRKDTQECITLASVAGFEVAYNRVFDVPVDSSNGGEGIDTKNACRDGIVHHNLVHDLVRVGIYCDAYEKELSNVEIYANTVFRCRQGIMVASEEGGLARDIRIHGNLVYDCPRAGIRVAGYLKGGPIQDLHVYQNTITGCGLENDPAERSGLMIDSINPANRAFLVHHNLISCNANQIHALGQPYLVLERNLLDGPSTEHGVDPLHADPGFVDPVARDFSLRPDSPALAASCGVLTVAPGAPA